MEKVNFYNVFISSPSDLKDERKKIKDFIDSYQYANKNVRLNGILWEKELAATSGILPQQLINPTLLKNADILIGLFSTRFGSPTENSESGTVEEIELFVNSGKPVVLYFIKDKDCRTTTELGLEDVRNLEKILEFKKQYSTKGIYKEIELSELLVHLKQDLDYNLQSILNQENAYNNDMENNKKNIANPKDKEKEILTANIESSETKYRGNWWADDSITKFINEDLISKGFGNKYKADITFYENLNKILGNNNDYTDDSTIRILKSAKKYAFNKKYGHFEYNKDLRKVSTIWAKKIKDRIVQLTNNNLNAMKIFDVGGNYGQELEDIFGKNILKQCTVLDISTDAIARGKKLYPDIQFIDGDMEDPYKVDSKYDICMCLRTIQSRGAFRQNVIIQMDKILAKNGLMLISIPNGYIDETNDKKIIHGLYDHRIKYMQERRPLQLARKISDKLIDYEYENVGMETLDTEVLIWGIKK